MSVSLHCSLITSPQTMASVQYKLMQAAVDTHIVCAVLIITVPFYPHLC